MLSRRILLANTIVLAMAPGLAQAQAQISLADRRAIAAYRQEKWPAIEKAIHDAAGFDVSIEVEWDRLTIAGDANNYANDDYFGKTIFEPLTMALRDVTKDQMGRDALKQKLKRISISYDEATAPGSNYPDGLKFESGGLSINWQPFSNASDVKPRSDALIALLEKNL